MESRKSSSNLHFSNLSTEKKCTLNFRLQSSPRIADCTQALPTYPQGSRPSLPRRRLPTRPDFTRQVHCKLLAPGASIRARRPPISRCPPSFISSRIALPFPFVFSRQASATCELRADLAAISQAQFAQATRASC